MFTSRLGIFWSLKYYHHVLTQSPPQTSEILLFTEATKKKLPEIIEVERIEVRNKRGSRVYVEKEVATFTALNAIAQASSTAGSIAKHTIPSKQMRNNSVDANNVYNDMDDPPGDYRVKKPKRSGKVSHSKVLAQEETDHHFFRTRISTYMNLKRRCKGNLGSLRTLYSD